MSFSSFILLISALEPALLHFNISMRKRLPFVCLCTLVWVAGGCGASPTAAPSPPPTATAPAQPARVATPTIAPSPTTAPQGTPTKSPLVTLVLRWEPGVHIADIDDVTELVTRLRDTPGIVDGYGDEIQITILYDPRQITPDAIQRKLVDLGYPTRKP